MKKIVYIIFLIIIVIMLSGCGNTESIKVGFVGNLTGANSDLGINGRNGVLIAVEEINAQGGINGRKVELVIKDDKNDKDEAMKADIELTNENVSSIIGHMTSGVIEEVVPLIDEKKMLMISPTVSTETLTGKDDYFLRVIPSNALMGKTLGEFAVERKIKKIAILYEEKNKLYGKTITDYFSDLVIKSGGEVVYSGTFASDKEINYKTIASDIKEKNPDGVIIIFPAMLSGILCQHLRNEGVTAEIFMSQWAMTEDLIKNGGKSVEGIFILNFFDLESNAKNYTDFSKKFNEKYNQKPLFPSLFGYETAKILFEGMKKSQDFKSEKIKNKIIEIGKFEGLQDEIFINQTGDSERKLYIYTIKDSKFVRFK